MKPSCSPDVSFVLQRLCIVLGASMAAALLPSCTTCLPCGPAHVEDLALLDQNRRTQVIAAPAILDYLPVYVASTAGGSELRSSPTVHAIAGGGPYETPVFGSEHGDVLPALWHRLEGLEIDAISVGQDWLRTRPVKVEHSRGGAPDPGWQWQLTDFSLESSNGSDGEANEAPSWAVIAFQQGVASGPPHLMGIYWGLESQLESLPDPTPPTPIVRGELTELLLVDHGVLDRSSEVTGLDITNWHLTRSYPRSASAAAARRRMPDAMTDDEYASTLSGKVAPICCAVYFSVTPKQENFDLLRKRMRGTPACEDWRSGATIFSLTASTSSSGAIKVGAIELEFVPGHTQRPYYGFQVEDDIDGLAVDMAGGVIVASLSDASPTDCHRFRGSSFYGWRTTSAFADGCPEGALQQRLTLPSPLHDWEGARLDAAVAEAAALLAASADDPPRPIRPDTACGDDPSRVLSWQAAPSGPGRPRGR